MFSGLFPSATNSSNLLSISPHTPIIAKTKVIVAKGYPEHVMGKATNDVF